MEMLESIENLKSIENTSKYYGKVRLINAGMLAKMLENIEHLEKQ